MGGTHTATLKAQRLLFFRDRDIETSKVGITRLDPQMPIERADDLWKKFQRSLGVLSDCNHAIQLVMGDFMLFCENMYGEKGYSIFDADDWKRLRNWRWVCSRVPVDMRSPSDKVGFAHYRAIVATPKHEWRYWMERVVDNDMSVRELTDALRRQAVERRLEGLEDREFWMEYAKLVNFKVEDLDAAMDNGREWAEREMHRIECTKSFDLWWADNGSRLEMNTHKNAAEAAWKAREL